MNNTINTYIMNHRIPIKAFLKITYACNFKCLHCYQTPQKNNYQKELSIDEWITILNVLKKENTIYLTFTGGEVFCKKDFLHLYKYAYNNDFKIKILSNISMLTKDDIETLTKYPPMEISTTLYGFTDKEYNQFTQTDNYRDKVFKNLLILKQAGISIDAKIIANIINVNGINDTVNYLNTHRIPYHIYYKISPFINGDKKPTRLQLDRKKIDRFSKKNTNIKELKQWATSNKPYSCDAGISSIRIDPYGNVYLCETSSEHSWNILKHTFTYCWNKIKAEREREICIKPPCDIEHCKYKSFCSACIPQIKNDYGKICVPIKNCQSAQKLYHIANAKELQNVIR